MKAEDTLKMALRTIQSRQQDYDTPRRNFERIAAMWSAYLSTKGEGLKLTPIDVAWMMVLLKAARAAKNPIQEDTVLDAAAYAALAGDVARED